MATVTMATAAGAAALLYYTLNRRLQCAKLEDDGAPEKGREVASASTPSPRNRISRRLARAPATWLETISTLSETLRFTYSETLGKWPIGDLAFGISYLLKRQGNFPIHSIYGGQDSLRLEGALLTAELKYMLNLLIICRFFSKMPFTLFLEAAGYISEDVLLHEPKADILKPAFAVLVDKKSNCILLVIRGTHSIRDTLTALTGAAVPFHHSILCGQGVSNLVLGYAHYGMVAAARWIAKLATPCLMEALQNHPDYSIKIVGHSLGGGTAALLTYILREKPEFNQTSCLAFAPAACMTWELAESGVDFITSVINGADLVPSFSAASVDDLRLEVTASAWINDLRSQIERTRILSTVYRSASALGSRLPSILNAKATVAGASTILRPVSSGTQVVMRTASSVAQAFLVRPAVHLSSSWSCIGPRRRNAPSTSNSTSEPTSMAPEGVGLLVAVASDAVASSSRLFMPATKLAKLETDCSSAEESCTAGIEEVDASDSDDIMDQRSIEDTMTEVELWQRLESELRWTSTCTGTGEDITGGLTVELDDSGVPEDVPNESKEVHRFYPPGKIMHIVVSPSEEETDNEEVSSCENRVDMSSDQNSGSKIGVFLTPRALYGKLRLSKMMVNDHFMPIYRRNIEWLISELENDSCSDHEQQAPSGSGAIYV